MALGPIPFTSIVEYARVYEIDDFEDFHYVIRRMDDAFLDLESKKSEKKSENKQNVSNDPSKTNKN
jgi:hypothetical protein